MITLTLDEADAIDWAIHCVRHLTAAAHCTLEEEGTVVDPCEMPEILGAIERHATTIADAVEAASARRGKNGAHAISTRTTTPTDR
jgi:hypothetical protein